MEEAAQFAVDNKFGSVAINAMKSPGHTPGNEVAMVANRQRVHHMWTKAEELERRHGIRFILTAGGEPFFLKRAVNLFPRD